MVQVWLKFIKCPLCAEKSSIEEATEKLEIFASKHAQMALYMQLKRDHSYFY